MSICDVCNEPIGPNSKRYTADQMRNAVRAGFRPPENVANPVAQMFETFGLPADAFINNWINQVFNDTTDWLLCASCKTALETTLKNAKPAGYCVFCDQPIYPHEQVAMLDEVSVAKLVALGAIPHPGPPSGKDKTGTTRWVACLRCMEDIDARAKRLQGM